MGYSFWDIEEVHVNWRNVPWFWQTSEPLWAFLWSRALCLGFNPHTGAEGVAGCLAPEQVGGQQVVHMGREKDFDQVEEAGGTPSLPSRCLSEEEREFSETSLGLEWAQG